MQRYPLAFALFWLLAATAARGAASAQAGHGAGHGAVCDGQVLETIDGGGYTYVTVDCGQEHIWAAGPQTSIAVGQTVSISRAMPMNEFHSDTLDRTFETIYFVASFDSPGADVGGGSASTGLEPAHGETGRSPERMDFSGIQRPAGGKTVAEVFAGKNQLAGKEVLVRGLVVKFSANIMSKNWIHLQDGTGAPGENDLTVTTADTAEIGDIVLVRGKLALDIDLGYGYHYEVVLENSGVTIE